MITIREETFHDVDAREALLDACFGPARFQKTCERQREGRMPADGLSLVMMIGFCAVPWASMRPLLVMLIVELGAPLTMTPG